MTSLVNPRNWFAEAIATYALVFFGPLAIILSVVAFGDGLSIESIIMIALAHGAAVGLMVYAFGHISGAHINPAVTIPMMITKKISVADGIGYIIFQLIGAVVAAFSLKAILPEIGAKVNFGTQGGPSELLNNSVMAGITVEIILTFFLVTVIFLTAVHKKAPAGIHGISIGGMVFLLHLVGVPLTGASMNPARTFGPAVVSGFWELHWLYWLAPIIGGIIAGVIMNYIFVNNGSTDNSLSLIKKSNIKYLDLKKNKGVGYALMIGFLYAKKYNFDYLVHLAGNGKMNPAQIDNFLEFKLNIGPCTERL